MLGLKLNHVSKRGHRSYILSDVILENMDNNHVDGMMTHALINSLAPGRFQTNFRKVIFQLILVTDDWSISCKIVLKWMPMDLTDGKSTLEQVMAWCRQATSHYLSQCWPRSLLPYGAIRPQWVKLAYTNNDYHVWICKLHDIITA